MVSVSVMVSCPAELENEMPACERLRKGCELWESSEQQIPAAELERVMKAPEVILKAAGKLK
jgi:hypothetical protein